MNKRHCQEIGGEFCLWPTWELWSEEGQSKESGGLLKDIAKSHIQEKKKSFQLHVHSRISFQIPKAVSTQTIEFGEPK